MVKTKAKSGTGESVLSTWHFRALDFIRGTGSRNLWLAFGLLILGLTITVLASLYVKSEVELAAEREFDFISSEIQLNIADRLAASAQVLFSGAALFHSSETVTRDEWRTFTSQLRLEEQLPGTQGVGFAVLIPPDQLDQHIQQIRDEGFAEYTVRPEGGREIYSSIIYLEPFSGRNLRAFGYNMFSEPVRRAAMEQARDENKAVLSGKVVLVQETDKDVQAGILMYVPIYRNGLPIETIAQRRSAIIGWVYSPYRMTDLMHGTLRNWEAQQAEKHFHLQVYDGDVISAETLLFDSRSEADKALADSSSEFSKLTPVDFQGHRWTLRFIQMGGLATLADYDNVWFVALGGTAFTFLLFGLVLSLLQTQVNARRIAEELTIELKESEEKYSIVFNNEVYAICIFDVETLQLLDVNKAYEQVYGYSREELLSGMTIHNITAELQASDAATVKVVREGTTFIPLLNHRRKNGTIFPVEIVGGLYVWRGRKVMFVLAHDITDRKKDEQEIRKLGRAVEQSPSSIVITGTDGSIEYVNPKFTEITGYTLAEAAGGNLRILKSGYTTEQEYRLLWETISSGSPWQGEFQNKKKNGELFWEKATIAPVWNDLGQITNFLAIKEDITLRKQAEDALTKSESKFRSLAENIPNTVFLCRNDSRYTFIYLNDAIEELTGYSKTEFLENGLTFFDLYHPDDLPLISIPQGAPNSRINHSAFHVTYRIYHSSGEVRWVDEWGAGVTNASGDVEFLEGIMIDITERKRSEEKLNEVQLFLNSVIEDSPTALWISDEHGTLMRMNQACRDVLQVRDEEVVGKYNLLRDDQIKAQGYMPQVRNVFEIGETARFLMTYNTADVKGLSFENTAKVVLDVNISAIRDAHGKVTNAIVQHVNITQLDTVKKELRESEERYRLLATTIPEPIFLQQEGRFIFANNAACKLFGAVKPQDLIGTPVIERVHPQYRQIVTDRIGGPDDKEETIAMIEEIYLRLDGSPVNVEVAANRLIMNGKVTMQVTAHDITERKKMVDALREGEQRYYRSEALLREAQSIAQVGSWTWDLKTQEVTWSDEMYRLFGIDKYSFTGRLGDVIRNVIHPDDLYVVLPSNAKSISEKAFEYRIILPDKSIRHIWAKTGDFLLDEAGNPILMSGIAQDVTDRKQTEEVIQRLNQQLGNVLEGTRDMIAMLDHELRYTLFNSAFHEEFKKIFGKDLKPGDSMPEALAHLPSDLAEVRKHWERALGDEDFIVSQQFGDTSLERNWYELHFSPVRDGTGQVIGAVHIIRNITERKLIEEALRASEVSLRKAQEIARIGNWELDLLTNRLKWSDEIYNLFEIDRETFDPSYEGFLNVIHPHDRALVNDKYQNSLKTREPYHVDHRLIMRDGRVKWVHEACETDFDAQGNPLLSKGAIQEITERKLLEQELKDQRDYVTQIINIMGQGLTVTDADGRFEFVNPAYASLFGYQPSDLIGKSPADISMPEENAVLSEHRKRRIQGQVSTYESRLVRADGSVADVLITGAPREVDGKYAGSIAVITDLSEQKQIENELRLREEKYRTVANFTYDWEAWHGADGMYLYTSPSCERITGHTAAEFLANPNLQLEIAHPDDQPILIEHRRAASHELKDQDLQIDFRIITPGAETRWIAHSCTSAYSESGQWLGRRESNRDITARRKAEDAIRLLNVELEQLAGTDGLTGIHNHRSLLKLAEREFDVAMRYQPPLAMMFFDVDHFKQINDTFGHAIGDEALKLTVQTVCTKLRSADLIGRYGGDEFVILLPQTSAQDALPLAERIHASIAEMRLVTNKGPLTLTISIGIAQSVHDGSQPDTIENLLLRADQALYAAKQAGRNRTVTFDERLSL